jgi:hypothetical protein
MLCLHPRIRAFPQVAGGREYAPLVVPLWCSAARNRTGSLVRRRAIHRARSPDDARSTQPRVVGTRDWQRLSQGFDSAREARRDDDRG